MHPITFCPTYFRLFYMSLPADLHILPILHIITFPLLFTQNSLPSDHHIIFSRIFILLPFFPSFTSLYFLVTLFYPITSYYLLFAIFLYIYSMLSPFFSFYCLQTNMFFPTLTPYYPTITPLSFFHVT